MNTQFANKLAAGAVISVLAFTLAGCNGEAVTDTRGMGSDSAPTTPAPVKSVEPVVEVTEEPSLDDLEAPDPEDENRWGIPVSDIFVDPAVDEAFGEGAGQRAAMDGLIGLSELVAQNPTLWTTHTDADEQLALAGWAEFITPDAYAEIEADFRGSANTIGATQDGVLVTLDGVAYSVPEGEMVTWYATTGVNVVVESDGVIGLAFDARVDAPTVPQNVSAVYEFYILVKPGDGDGWLVDDVQYEVPNGVVVAGE